MTEDIQGESQRLEDEAKRELLKAIIDDAPKSKHRLEANARAFALVVGARYGVVPGGPLAVKSG